MSHRAMEGLMIRRLIARIATSLGIVAAGMAVGLGEVALVRALIAG